MSMTKAARERVAKFRRMEATGRRRTVESLARYATDSVTVAELSIIATAEQIKIRQAKKEFGLKINRKTGV